MLIGTKIGMSQFFAEDGRVVPVTVLKAGPCVVTQVKTKVKDGYSAVQLGFGSVKKKRLTKALQGHLKGFAGADGLRRLREVRTESAEQLAVGKVLTAALFKVGDLVCISGVSKGKGFQGVIKRWAKAGGPASHGSTFHRSTGSIGQRTYPGKVFKLMKLPGHMGVERVTIKDVEVVGVLPAEDVLLVRGPVPGSRNSLVMIISQDKGFLARLEEEQDSTKMGAGAA